MGLALLLVGKWWWLVEWRKLLAYWALGPVPCDRGSPDQRLHPDAETAVVATSLVFPATCFVLQVSVCVAGARPSFGPLFGVTVFLTAFGGLKADKYPSFIV